MILSNNNKTMFFLIKSMSIKKINERSLKSGQNLNNNCSVKIIKRIGSLLKTIL